MARRTNSKIYHVTEMEMVGACQNNARKCNAEGNDKRETENQKTKSKIQHEIATQCSDNL
jgi:hypothetical protein